MQDFLKKNIKKAAYAVVIAVFGIMYCTSMEQDMSGHKGPVVVESESQVTQAETDRVVLCVYVCGAVNVPGVYELPGGSRIVDAIDMAQGITKDGDLSQLNLAQPIADGIRIYVPEHDEADRNSQSGLININTASAERLMELPGVGQSKAEDIISYRNANGGFKTIDDIMKVPGIKEGAFLKIKDYITVS